MHNADRKWSTFFVVYTRHTPPRKGLHCSALQLLNMFYLLSRLQPAKLTTAKNHSLQNFAENELVTYRHTRSPLRSGRSTLSVAPFLAPGASSSLGACFSGRTLHDSKICLEIMAQTKDNFNKCPYSNKGPHFNKLHFNRDPYFHATRILSPWSSIVKDAAPECFYLLM